jgi:hypothetical protein
MAEKHKPVPRIVKRAAVLINDPQSATSRDIREMSSRILNDQKNDPEPGRPSPEDRRYGKKKR